MVWIDFYGSLYIPTDNFNNLHPLSPFLGPVDIHFRIKMAAQGPLFALIISNIGVKSLISVEKNGPKSLLFWLVLEKKIHGDPKLILSQLLFKLSRATNYI